MRKLLLLSIFSLSFIFFLTPTSLAQTSKTITLSDGTTIKGVVKSLNNGTYTIETNNLGTLQIKDTNVVSITTGSLPAQQATNSLQNSLQNPLQKSQMTNKINMLQSSIMSDPALMQELQKLISNPNIMKAMSDQNFLNDVMSQDPQRIQNNPKTQQLMNDPEVRRMMEILGQKFSGGQLGQ